jgi:hypothetical protein
MAPAGASCTAGPRLLHMGKRDDQWRTAIHEAAHIIAAHELGLPVYSAQIGRRRGFASIAGLRGIDANWHHCGDYRAGDTRIIINAELQICLAGPIGQAIHDGSEHGCEGDEQMIDQVRQRFGVTDARMKRLKRRTRSLLLDHWGDVIRLAAALLDAGALERGEIVALLER